MDFHAMKRKELQALCKQHNIPANLTNLEMANKLSSLLNKEVDNKKPNTRLRSCLKNVGDPESNSASDGGKQSKKVKFSPQNETVVVVVESESEDEVVETKRVTRRKSMASSVPKKGQDLADNVDKPVKSSEEIVDKPVRPTRSTRGRNAVDGGEVSVKLPVGETKKRKDFVDNVEKPVKSSEEVIDKPVRPTRSTRGRNAVDGAEVSDKLPVAETKKRKDLVANVDKPVKSSEEVVDKPVDEVVVKPVRPTRSTRGRNAVDGGEVSVKLPVAETKKTEDLLANVDKPVKSSEEVVEKPVVEVVDKRPTRSTRGRNVVDGGDVSVKLPVAEIKKKKDFVDNVDKPVKSSEEVVDKPAEVLVGNPVRPTRSTRGQNAVDGGEISVKLPVAETKKRKVGQRSDSVGLDDVSGEKPLPVKENPVRPTKSRSQRAVDSDNSEVLPMVASKRSKQSDNPLPVMDLSNKSANQSADFVDNVENVKRVSRRMSMARSLANKAQDVTEDVANVNSDKELVENRDRATRSRRAAVGLRNDSDDRKAVVKETREPIVRPLRSREAAGNKNHKDEDVVVAEDDKSKRSLRQRNVKAVDESSKTNACGLGDEITEPEKVYGQSTRNGKERGDKLQENQDLVKAEAAGESRLESLPTPQEENASVAERGAKDETVQHSGRNVSNERNLVDNEVEVRRVSSRRKSVAITDRINNVAEDTETNGRRKRGRDPTFEQGRLMTDGSLVVDKLSRRSTRNAAVKETVQERLGASKIVGKEKVPKKSNVPNQEGDHLPNSSVAMKESPSIHVQDPKSEIAESESLDSRTVCKMIDSTNKSNHSEMIVGNSEVSVDMSDLAGVETLEMENSEEVPAANPLLVQKDIDANSVDTEDIVKNVERNEMPAAEEKVNSCYSDSHIRVQEDKASIPIDSNATDESNQCLWEINNSSNHTNEVNHDLLESLSREVVVSDTNSVVQTESGLEPEAEEDVTVDEGFPRGTSADLCEFPIDRLDIGDNSDDATDIEKNLGRSEMLAAENLGSSHSEPHLRVHEDKTYNPLDSDNVGLSNQPVLVDAKFVAGTDEDTGPYENTENIPEAGGEYCTGNINAADHSICSREELSASMRVKESESSLEDGKATENILALDLSAAAVVQAIDSGSSDASAYVSTGKQCSADSKFEVSLVNTKMTCPSWNFGEYDYGSAHDDELGNLFSTPESNAHTKQGTLYSETEEVPTKSEKSSISKVKNGNLPIDEPRSDVGLQNYEDSKNAGRENVGTLCIETEVVPCTKLEDSTLSEVKNGNLHMDEPGMVGGLQKDEYNKNACWEYESPISGRKVLNVGSGGLSGNEFTAVDVSPATATNFSLCKDSFVGGNTDNEALTKLEDSTLREVKDGDLHTDDPGTVVGLQKDEGAKNASLENISPISGRKVSNVGCGGGSGDEFSSVSVSPCTTDCSPCEDSFAGEDTDNEALTELEHSTLSEAKNRNLPTDETGTVDGSQKDEGEKNAGWENVSPISSRDVTDADSGGSSGNELTSVDVSPATATDCNPCEDSSVGVDTDSETLTKLESESLDSTDKSNHSEMTVKNGDFSVEMSDLAGVETLVKVNAEEVPAANPLLVQKDANSVDTEGIVKNVERNEMLAAEEKVDSCYSGSHIRVCEDEACIPSDSNASGDSNNCLWEKNISSDHANEVNHDLLESLSREAVVSDTKCIVQTESGIESNAEEDVIVDEVFPRVTSADHCQFPIDRLDIGDNSVDAMDIVKNLGRSEMVSTEENLGSSYSESDLRPHEDKTYSPLDSNNVGLSNQPALVVAKFVAGTDEDTGPYENTENITEVGVKYCTGNLNAPDHSICSREELSASMRVKESEFSLEDDKATENVLALDLSAAAVVPAFDSGSPVANAYLSTEKQCSADQKSQVSLVNTKMTCPSRNFVEYDYCNGLDDEFGNLFSTPESNAHTKQGTLDSETKEVPAVSDECIISNVKSRNLPTDEPQSVVGLQKYEDSKNASRENVGTLCIETEVVPFTKLEDCTLSEVKMDEPGKVVGLQKDEDDKNACWGNVSPISSRKVSNVGSGGWSGDEFTAVNLSPDTATHFSLSEDSYVGGDADNEALTKLEDSTLRGVKNGNLNTDEPGAVFGLQKVEGAKNAGLENVSPISSRKVSNVGCGGGSGDEFNSVSVSPYTTDCSPFEDSFAGKDTDNEALTKLEHTDESGTVGLQKDEDDKNAGWETVSPISSRKVSDADSGGSADNELTSVDVSPATATDCYPCEDSSVGVDTDSEALTKLEDSTLMELKNGNLHIVEPGMVVGFQKDEDEKNADRQNVAPNSSRKVPGVCGGSSGNEFTSVDVSPDAATDCSPCEDSFVEGDMDNEALTSISWLIESGHLDYSERTLGEGIIQLTTEERRDEETHFTVDGATELYSEGNINHLEIEDFCHTPETFGIPQTGNMFQVLFSAKTSPISDNKCSKRPEYSAKDVEQNEFIADSYAIDGSAQGHGLRALFTSPANAIRHDDKMRSSKQNPAEDDCLLGDELKSLFGTPAGSTHSSSKLMFSSEQYAMKDGIANVQGDNTDSNDDVVFSSEDIPEENAQERMLTQGSVLFVNEYAALENLGVGETSARAEVRDSECLAEANKHAEIAVEEEKEHGESLPLSNELIEEREPEGNHMKATSSVLAGAAFEDAETWQPCTELVKLRKTLNVAARLLKTTTTMKRREPLTSLDQGTPKKLISFDMKENAAVSTKMDNNAGSAQPKSTVKRRALQDIPNK